MMCAVCSVVVCVVIVICCDVIAALEPVTSSPLPSAPVIVDQPQDQYITRATQSVTLNCGTRGGSASSAVTWYLDGQPISVDSVHRVVLASGQLVLRRGALTARCEFCGGYYCNVSNTATGDSVISRTAHLTFAEKPLISQGPKDTIVPESSDVLLQCLVTGDPLPVIVWKKLDGQIPAERSQILSDQSLKIIRTQSVDEGIYVCRAENAVGSQESIARLTVLTKPSFIVGPSIKKMSVGRKVVIRCVAAGNPKPTVFWNQISSQKLFPGPNSGARIYVTEDGSLNIESLRYEDAGEYSCQALNSVGSAFSNTRVIVTNVDIRPPPIIYQGAQNQTLPVDTTATLPCLASSEPSPTVVWLKAGQVLTGREPRINILNSGALQITDLKLSDTSVYTCLAISESGETAWSAGLIVELPSNPSVVFHRTPESSTFPGAPSRPTVSDITDSSLRLSWRPSENNGASPIHSYVVEYFTHQSDKGWIVASDSVSDPSYAIRNLLPNTTYMFLVRAQNSHGLSLPSPVTTAIRTRVQARSPLIVTDTYNRLSIVVVNLYRVDVYNSTTIRLNWQISQHHHFDGYHIKYRALSNHVAAESQVTVVTLLSPAATKYVLGNLEKSTWYEVYVQPFDGLTAGRPSNIVRVFTSDNSESGDETVTSSVVSEAWFISTLVSVTAGAILCLVCVVVVCLCKQRAVIHRKTIKTPPAPIVNSSVHSSSPASRAPLLSANHLLPPSNSYRDDKVNTASYMDDKNSAFNRVYHLLEPNAAAATTEPMMSSISPYATTFIDDMPSVHNSSIPDPQAYMIHPPITNYTDFSTTPDYWTQSYSPSADYSTPYSEGGTEGGAYNSGGSLEGGAYRTPYNGSMGQSGVYNTPYNTGGVHNMPGYNSNNASHYPLST